MSRFKKILVFFLVFITLLILIFLYGKYIGAKWFKVNEIRVVDKVINNDYNGFKIAHISDLHYGLNMNAKDLEKIIKEINNVKPDILIFTGDLIENAISLKQHNEIVNKFNKLDKSIIKYAISGNHDSRYKKFNMLLEDSGFINLDNSVDTIYKNSNEFLLIAGLGSGFENNNIQERFKKIQEEIDTMENTSFYNILLLHEPDFIDKINIDEFNMILAGHSHDGQIKIPFIGSVVRPKYADIYYESEYKINNTNLYISNGLGTSILPLRYFNRPSFNVYRLNTK